MKKAHALGLMNTDTPEELGKSSKTPAGPLPAGGLDLTLAAKTKIYEEIAYGDTGIGTSLMVNELAQIPILYAGSQYLKETYMARMPREPILAVSFCTICVDC